jgi:23S rRNA A1618 N6-methylase RlmF
VETFTSSGQVCGKLSQDVNAFGRSYPSVHVLAESRVESRKKISKRLRNNKLIYDLIKAEERFSLALCKDGTSSDTARRQGGSKQLKCLIILSS